MASDPRPDLTPKELGGVPLTDEQHNRRADLPARLREANRPWR
ncbi:hypothetical protein [Kitasatospora sp. NPDC094016]